MTLQVSKNKLRRLPYVARLNMIKHQQDYVDEIKALIKEYPDRDHPDAEDYITRRAPIHTIVSFYSIRGINVPNVTRGLCERLPLHVSVPASHAWSLQKSLPAVLLDISRYHPSEDITEALQMLTDVYLLINETERKKSLGYSGLECLTPLFIKLHQQMDANKIVDGVLPYLGNSIIAGIIIEIYSRITDPELRAHIVNCIQIHDIIT